jgi:hypothetical protein
MPSREAQTFLLVPLLPIFLLGFFPMLMMAFLGFAGLAILGVLLICTGLSDGLEAHSQFNRQVIVGGYAPRSERAVDTSTLHSATRLATALNLTGAGFIVVGLFGLFYFG